VLFSLKTNSFMSLQDCMRGSLAKARVLFAPVEEIGSEDRLLRACRIQIFIYTNKEKEEYYLLKLGLNFFCHLNKFF
jgi:hypothetical protein